MKSFEYLICYYIIFYCITLYCFCIVHLEIRFFTIQSFFHSGPVALREKKLCIVKNLISKWTIQTHYIIVQLKYAVENLQHNFNGIVNLNHVEYSNISIR